MKKLLVQAAGYLCTQKHSATTLVFHAAHVTQRRLQLDFTHCDSSVVSISLAKVWNKGWVLHVD
jgi:hypothetical protein